MADEHPDESTISCATIHKSDTVVNTIHELSALEETLTMDASNDEMSQIATCVKSFGGNVTSRADVSEF